MDKEITVLDDTLYCPRCGEGYLHSTDVFVFSRGEDADKVTVTTTKEDGSVVQSVPPNDLSGNPSSRRHGIKIEFYCEYCHEWGNVSQRFYLNIAQHKGVTFMSWDDKYGDDT